MNILIIGKNSYIGNHIDEWLRNYSHKVEQLDVLNDEWKTFDYSKYDVIVHVAGIVHQPKCKDWNLFKRVNTDMPIAIATMAKQQGVKHYVYFSTMGVYKSKGKQLDSSIIDGNTPLLNGGNLMYGLSKKMAEDGLLNLQDENFIVSFVRPPSVYGRGCKGGYITGFTKIVKILLVIPKAYTSARQSFIYIDNLTECVRIIIDNKLAGVFCPQDDMIPNANELFKTIADGIGKRYIESRLLGVCMQLVSWIPLVKKSYGGIEYARELSDIKGFNYVVVPFAEAMKRTVSK